MTQSPLVMRQEEIKTYFAHEIRVKWKQFRRLYNPNRQGAVDFLVKIRVN